MKAVVMFGNICIVAKLKVNEVLSQQWMNKSKILQFLSSS